jgi:chromosome segregation ATPase
MLEELPMTLIQVTGGAFLLGWLLSYISTKLGAKFKAMKRDPRDDRIRSLEADLRVARSDKEKKHESVERLEEELKETTVGLERRDNVISSQQAKLEDVSRDLKDSVIKTRELRAELAERATENVHAEAKIREVQTELSVAHASKDLLSTGVLEYDLTPGDDQSDDLNDGNEKPGARKAST